MMIFIDSSIIVEILIDGSRADALLARLEQSVSVFTGPTVIYESVTVLSSRLGREPREALQLVQHLIDRFDIKVRPATQETASLAIEAFSRFGKGRHPAKLNFGDCFSYAGARESGAPLLYVGDDFARTDLV